MHLSAGCLVALYIKALSEVSTRLHLGSAQALLEPGPHLALISCQRGLVCFEQSLEMLCGEGLRCCCLSQNIQSFPQRPSRDSSIRMPGSKHLPTSFQRLHQHGASSSDLALRT